jgi:hypothetical protein
MKSVLVISICLAFVVATTAIRTREEAIAKARRNGGRHERQRRNHRDRHKRQNNIVGELDASVATESKHHRNHTHSIGNQNELVAVSGQIDEVHHYNHTHQLKNATDGSVLKTNITHTERNKEKKEKRAKAKAQKTMSNQDVNTTTILPLLAENATTHHKHEGRHEHNQTAKEDDTAQPNATSAAVSEASTKNVTEASSFTTATKMLVPSTSSRAGGEGADPKRAWEEDPQVEAVLAEVEAEFEAKKQQSEEIMGQQMMNSASTFTIGLSIIVGVVVQTIAHHLIV